MTIPKHTPIDKLRELGIELPSAPKAVASYVPALLDGDLLLVSGQLPFVDGELRETGTVPEDVDVETAVECARLCGVNALAAARDALGSLDRITRVLRLGCFVASPAGFGGQPAIANGASELMLSVFGDAGRHARAAVGVSTLPLNAPVEIEFMFRVRD